MVKALVDTLAETVPDAKAKTPFDTLKRYEGGGTNGQVGNTLVDMKAEAERLGHTLRDAERQTTDRYAG